MPTFFLKCLLNVKLLIELLLDPDLRLLLGRHVGLDEALGLLLDAPHLCLFLHLHAAHLTPGSWLTCPHLAAVQ